MVLSLWLLTKHCATPEDDLVKSWKWRLWGHRLELLLAAALLAAVALALGVGLGGRKFVTSNTYV